MKSASVNIYDVQVIFDAGNKTFNYKGDVTGTSIHIAPGIQMINFTLSTVNTLSTANGSEATFKFYPIQWVGIPDLLPAEGRGQWFDSTRCRLVVFNSNNSTAKASYGFVLTVMYEGISYTSPDPTIINDPPVGG